MMIINAGSENKGGTFEQALFWAKDWLKDVQKEFPEVKLVSEKEDNLNGNWLFNFKHGITGVVVLLRTHGFTKDECEAFMFHPRVYWNGSSTGNPEIKDWLKEGFSYKIQYFKNKEL